MQITIPRVIKNWASGKDIRPAKDGFIQNGNGPGRKFAIEESDPYWADAFSAFGLTPECVEPMFQIFTGVHYLAGAFTNLHKDNAPFNYAHVRCNVVLEKPKDGGLPIIDGEVIDVEPGDLWLVIASMEAHGSTPISEPKRIIKSFGGLIQMKEIKPLIRRM